MNQLFHYFSIDWLWGKSLYSFKYLFVLNAVLLLFELFFKKRESTLYLMKADITLYRYDIFCFIFNSIGLKKAFANLFSLGMIRFVSEVSSQSGFFPIFKLDEFPSLVSFIIIILSYDFLAYWLHRLRHHSHFLWASHSFHHSCTSVNSLTTSRQHITDYMNYYFLLLLPISLLFPVEPQNFFTWFVLESGIQVLSHSKLNPFKGSLLELIFVSSDSHRRHHSIDGSGQRSNFGSIFIFWDKLFKTYSPLVASDFGLKGEFQENDSFLKGYLKPFKSTAIEFLRLLKLKGF